MSDDIILNELRSLRQDLGSLNERFVSVRYDDLKRVFIGEMREALGEQARYSMRSDLDSMQTASTCDLRFTCMGKLRGLIDAVTAAMEGDDLTTAYDLLAETDDLLCGDTSPCLDGDCSRSASETIRRTKLMLDLYSGLLSRLDSVSSGDVKQPAERKRKMVDPKQAERALGPLANTHRLMVIGMLAEERRTLTEIGRKLNMRTGHLQFHMKVLREAGYVTSDHRSHLYSLTPKGAKALDAVNDMIPRLSE